LTELMDGWMVDVVMTVPLSKLAAPEWWEFDQNIEPHGCEMDDTAEQFIVRIRP